jgi:hypothetical protein
MAQLASVVVDYAIGDSVEQAEELRNVFRQVLEEQYQDGVVDMQNVCSTWPQECTVEDSILSDSIFSDLGTIAHNIAVYQDRVSESDDDFSKPLKVIYVDNKIPQNRFPSFVAYFRTWFNEGVEPDGYIWIPSTDANTPPSLVAQANRRVFDEYLDEDMIDAAHEATDDGSTVTTAIFKTTTVKNAAFGVPAGRKLEIFAIKPGSFLPSDLFGKLLASIFKQPFVSPAAEISGNQILKERLAAFLEEIPMAAPTSDTPTTSPSSAPTSPSSLA